MLKIQYSAKFNFPVNRCQSCYMDKMLVLVDCSSELLQVLSERCQLSTLNWHRSTSYLCCQNLQQKPLRRLKVPVHVYGMCELLYVRLDCCDCCGVVDDVKPKLKFTEGCGGVCKPINPQIMSGVWMLQQQNIILCSCSITSLLCRCFQGFVMCSCPMNIC